jgi:hypothetical protein
VRTVIPEPTSAGLGSLAGIALVAMRRIGRSWT